MMIVEKHWFEVPQMRDLDRYIAETRMGPNQRTLICRRVNRCAGIAGGLEALAACDAKEFVAEYFPEKRFLKSAIRWYQRFVRGEPAQSWKRPVCWAGEPLLVRFDRYLVGKEGYSTTYSKQICSMIYWMRYPRSASLASESTVANIRRRLWAIRAFDRFCRYVAHVPQGQRIQIRQKTPHWTASPLMVRFRDGMVAARHVSGGAALYCQILYSFVSLPKPAEPIAETDLDKIVAARLPGRSRKWYKRAVCSIRAFEKFLRAEAGIPEPVKVKPPKPVQVRAPRPPRPVKVKEVRSPRPPKVKKVREPKPPKVKIPKPAKVKAVKPPKPVPFGKIVLARFEQYLLSTETPPQYAETICHSIDWIRRRSAPYEVLAVCDPVVFVAEHWPRGDWAQTRSRVATIRRFQEFWRASEQVQMVEGVLA